MFKRIHESGLWLILAMFAASIGFISLMWVRGSDFGVNVGFLVPGVLLSIATTLVAEVRERNLKTTDLARVLYAETAHLVARCCFDSEAPWKEYWIGWASPGSMNSVRLRKFTPVVPVVCLATAGQLSLLRGTAPQDLIEFQYRLSALRREIENIAKTHWHAFIESDEGFVPEVAKDTAIDCGAVGDPKILNTHQFRQQIWTKVPKAA